jgi:hypothetical protein
VWSSTKGIKKIISKFYNQSFLSIENEQERIGNSFHFDPFDLDGNNCIRTLFESSK